jgi:hypothetical protein
MTRTSISKLVSVVLALSLSVVGAGRVRAFDLVFSISSQDQFTANQLSIVNTALVQVEAMWETVITGYQPGISIGSVPITIFPSTSGLASASFSSTTLQGGYTLSTSGFVNINTLEIENFANWQGDQPNGLNFIDELLAHEVGHALGIGTLWITNNVYQNSNFQYIGQHGAAAYAAEFNDGLLFAPIENAGNAGTPHSHWDQLMRSSPQEGNPADPWTLDPRVGAVDPYGRDRALELMTGAIDPDFFEPFISRFTVQSMRDMGYTVTEFEDFNGDGAIDVGDFEVLRSNMGTTGLAIDSMRFGDADRDRDIDLHDFGLWKLAAGVPEPGSATLAALAALALMAVCRRS